MDLFLYSNQAIVGKWWSSLIVVRVSINVLCMQMGQIRATTAGAAARVLAAS